MTATVGADEDEAEIMGKVRIIERGRAFYPRLVKNERAVENF
jgi:hypothetical protein